MANEGEGEVSSVNAGVVVICLYCGALIVCVLTMRFSARPHIAELVLCALMGSVIGFMVAAMVLPPFEGVLLSWCRKGSFLQRTLPELWPVGGAVTGALVGILLVQWSRRDRK